MITVSILIQVYQDTVSKTGTFSQINWDTVPVLHWDVWKMMSPGLVLHFRGPVGSKVS